MRRSKQHASACMDAEIRDDFEIQDSGFRPMIELEDKRRIRRDHTAKLESVHGAKLGWQVETFPSAADHPVQLYYARKNRLARKMAVEIDQIVRAGQFENGALRGFLDQTAAWRGAKRPMREQSRELGVCGFTLGFDR